MVLAQQGVADKGSELAAIPELLRALELRGCLVSLDALGCQREIASARYATRSGCRLPARCQRQSNLMPQQALQDALAEVPDAAEHTCSICAGTGSAERPTGASDHQRRTGRHGTVGRLPDACALISLRSEAGKPATPQMRYLHQFSHTHRDALAWDASSLAYRKRSALAPGCHLSRRRLRGQTRQCARESVELSAGSSSITSGIRHTPSVACDLAAKPLKPMMMWSALVFWVWCRYDTGATCPARLPLPWPSTSPKQSARHLVRREEKFLARQEQHA